MIFFPNQCASSTKKERVRFGRSSENIITRVKYYFDTILPLFVLRGIFNLHNPLTLLLDRLFCLCTNLLESKQKVNFSMNKFSQLNSRINIGILSKAVDPLRVTGKKKNLFLYKFLSLLSKIHICLHFPTSYCGKTVSGCFIAE